MLFASVSAIAQPGPTQDIVVGFVGGFVHANDSRHSEVQLIQQLQEAYGSRVHVEIYTNRDIAEAQQSVLTWLDSDRDQQLSGTEKRQARIVLFGHSWGAAAAVSLARKLERDGIPVLLTIQVDSINKKGQNDYLIPDNVERAVNFYQTGGILHGERNIRAADPAHTHILGNVRFDYRKTPEECSAYPWYDRFFFKGHTAIECDPRVWSQVKDLIETTLSVAGDSPASLTAQVGN